MNRIRIADVDVDILSAAELAERLRAFLDSTKFHQLMTINPEYLVEASHNAQFRGALRNASLKLVDGAGILLMARFSGLPVRLNQRITGVELTRQLLESAVSKKLRVLVLLPGNAITSDSKLESALTRKFHGLNFSVMREPFDVASVARQGAQILLVAFGSPRQDLWIAEHQSSFPTVRIAVGVGGTLDFISGTMMRAPRFLQRLGLEWLWRLILEPKRIPRIIRAVIVFPLLVLRSRKT